MKKQPYTFSLVKKVKRYLTSEKNSNPSSLDPELQVLCSIDYKLANVDREYVYVVNILAKGMHCRNPL